MDKWQGSRIWRREEGRTAPIALEAALQLDMAVEIRERTEAAEHAGLAVSPRLFVSHLCLPHRWTTTRAVFLARAIKCHFGDPTLVGLWFEFWLKTCTMLSLIFLFFPARSGSGPLPSM